MTSGPSVDVKRVVWINDGSNTDDSPSEQSVKSSGGSLGPNQTSYSAGSQRANTGSSDYELRAMQIAKERKSLDFAVSELETISVQNMHNVRIFVAELASRVNCGYLHRWT
jgi:hypothetical protein